jgi:hypothetical protein
MRLFLVGLCLLLTACATPLQKLQTRMERSNAYNAEYVPPTEVTKACSDGVALLTKNAELLGITIVYFDTDGAQGMAQFQSRVVIIDPLLHGCGILEVLSHEMAHLQTPKPLYMLPQDRETFADAVSFLIVKELGKYDASERYGQFLSRFKTHSRVISLYDKEIKQAVKDILQKK